VAVNAGYATDLFEPKLGTQAAGGQIENIRPSRPATAAT
jgi:hypothetical protein